MQLGTGCVGSLTPVERFGIYKVTSGSMSDLTDFSSAFSMTSVGFSCSPNDFNGSSTVSYDGSSTMKNSLAGFESNKNKSVLYTDIDEMEVDGGSGSYTGNRARATLTSSFLDGISSALSLGVSDRHREFDLTLQVTSGEYSMSSDSPVFVKTDPNLSPIGKLAPVSPSPSVPMTLPEIDDLPTPRRTDADLPGLVVPDDDTIVCENNGIISIKRRGVSEPLLSPDVMSQLTGLQEIGPTGIANIENALPGPLVTTKVMGQSNQQQEPAPSLENPQEITNLNKAELVITGKNLLDESLFQADTGNTNAPIFLAKGTYVVSVQNDTKWWETASNKQTIFVHTFDTNEFVAEVEFTNLIQGKRSYGRLTINKDCNIKIYSYSGWKHEAVSKIQLEAGTEATAYEPHKSKSTPIDLKGNELCSLPNGVKDEVVIDAEGNVSLIKRTKQYDWNCVQIIKGTGRNYAVDKVLDIEANYTGLVAEKAINAVNNTIGICYVNQKMIYVTVPESVTTKEQANQLYGGMKVIYQLAEPQIIPLGKVELPALPEATSNVWNNGNIPADVSIIFYNENGRLLSKAIPEVDVATVDEVKKFLGIK